MKDVVKGVCKKRSAGRQAGRPLPGGRPVERGQRQVSWLVRKEALVRPTCSQGFPTVSWSPPDPGGSDARGISMLGCLLLLGIFAATAGPAAARMWKQGPPPPPGTDVLPRARAAVAYDLARHRVVMFGGTTIAYNRGYDNQTWEFDGTNWIKGPAAPKGLVQRIGHAMAYDPVRSRMVLFGGDGPGGVLNDTWFYDGVSWQSGPAAPPGLTPRRIYAMAYDGSRDRMVIFGGWDGRSALQDTWEFDGSGWQPGPAALPVPPPRYSHALAYDSSRQVTLLFGGADGGRVMNDLWEYDGSGWRQAAPAPAARYAVAMTYDPVRQVAVVIGGGDNAGTPQRQVWEYDGTGWMARSSPPGEFYSRIFSGAAFNPDSASTVIIGGFCSGRQYDPVRDSWSYDGTTWVRNPDPVRGLTGREGHVLVYDSLRKRVVLFGGGLGCDRRDGVWAYDGTGWVLIATAPDIVWRRSGAEMVYDSRRDRIVLFGGEDISGNDRNDTWEFDGTGWQQGPMAPPQLTPRSWPGMAFDSGRGRTVLFGGATGVSYHKDTWEYDGSAWTLTVPAAVEPYTRTEPAMAYDAARKVIVMWGGDSAHGTKGLDDTWEYDGTSWSRGPGPASGQLPGTNPSMVYDSSRSVMVMVNGNNGTWEYDGAAWRPGGSSGGMLNAHFYSAVGMAYDANRQRPVIFGAGVHLNETWEYEPGNAGYLCGAGPGQGNPNRVAVYDFGGVPTTIVFDAYGAGSFGTNVAAGSLDGNGQDVILTGPGPGSVFGPEVRGFRGVQPLARIDFFAYGTLRFGVGVAATKLDGDAFEEIVTGAGPGAVFGPHVRGFNDDGAGITPIGLVNFYAYRTLHYGVNAGGGDVDGDGFGEILTGPGPGLLFGPVVRGFDVDGGAVGAIAALHFGAFSSGGYGVRVASGDFDADSVEEIAASPGPGPGLSADLRGFDYDGAAVTALPGFSATPFATAYGARPHSGNLLLWNRAQILMGAGPDPAADSSVTTLLYDGSQVYPLWQTFQAFPQMQYGVNVSSGMLGL